MSNVTLFLDVPSGLDSYHSLITSGSTFELINTAGQILATGGQQVLH